MNSDKVNLCFVVGNGPSINAEMLDSIYGYKSFAMNGISSIFGSTIWRPSYMVSVTTAITEPVFREIIYAGVDHALIESYIYDPIGVPSKYKPVLLNPKYGDIHPNRIALNHWSDKPLEWIGKCGTTSFAVLQLAVWLGYTHIVLLGMDMNYSKPSNTDPNHYEGYPLSTVVSACIIDYDELNLGHYRAHITVKKICDYKGIVIVNATPGASNDPYPAIDLRRNVLDVYPNPRKYNNVA